MIWLVWSPSHVNQVHWQQIKGVRRCRTPSLPLSSTTRELSVIRLSWDPPWTAQIPFCRRSHISIIRSASVPPPSTPPRSQRTVWSSLLSRRWNTPTLTDASHFCCCLGDFCDFENILGSWNSLNLSGWDELKIQWLFYDFLESRHFRFIFVTRQ